MKIFKSFQLPIVLEFFFFFVIVLGQFAVIAPSDLAWIRLFSDKNLSIFALILIVLSLTIFLSIKNKSLLTKIFYSLPLFMFGLPILAFIIKPSPTWIFLPIIMSFLWLATSVAIYLGNRYKWLGALTLFLFSTFSFTALTNLLYYHTIGGNMPWMQIVPIFKEAFLSGNPSDGLKYIGLSKTQGLIIVLVYLVFISYPFLLACKFPAFLTDFHRKKRYFAGNLTLLALLLIFYKTPIHLLPLKKVVEWYQQSGFFDFSQVPHLDRVELKDIIHDKTLAIDMDRLVDRSSYSWNIESKERKNLIFLTIESWRREALEYMPFVRSLTTKGIFLSNHYSPLNESIGGDTSIFYSIMPPYILSKKNTNKNNYFKAKDVMPASAPFECYEYFLRPSNWIEFLKKSGYIMHRITQTVTLQYPQYYGKNVKETEKELGFPEKDCKNIFSERMVELLLEYLKQPGLKLINVIFFDTHYNYHYPDEYEIYKPAIDLNFAIAFDQTPSNLLKLNNRYANAAYYTDAMIRKFFKKAELMGFLKDSIFVITGDHGEGMGENGSIFHACGPHENQFKTSAIIIGPNIPAIEIDSITTHEDIIPTLGVYAGFSAAACQGINVLESNRNFLLSINIGSPRTIIIRHKKYMNMFEVTTDGTLRWRKIAKNTATIDDDIYELLEEKDLKRLSELIVSDRKLIVDYFNTHKI